MAGPIILSNRLKGFQDAVRGFGETVAQTEKDRLLAEQADRQKQMLDLQLAEARRQEEKRLTQEQNIARFRELEKQGLPEFVGAPSVASQPTKTGLDLGGFTPAPMSLPASPEIQALGIQGAKDTSRDLMDEILANYQTSQTGSLVTKDMIRQGREDALMKKEQEKTLFDLTEKKTKADIRKTEAEIQKMNREAQNVGLPDPEKVAAIEEKLRKEFIAQNKEFQSVGDAYGRIKAAGQEPTAAGDLALIFNYMKMLDPGSVVRESEFATAQNAAGIPDRVRNMYNKALRGERLAESQRADFIGRSEKLYDSAKDGYGRSVSAYSDLAKKYGVKPERVIIDLTRTTEGSVSAPGGVEEWGYVNGVLQRVK